MVRPLRAEDREVIKKILQDNEMFTLAEIECALDQVDLFIHQPHQKDYQLMVVENEKGQVAGFISYGPTPLTEGTYDLYWIALAPSEQQKGLGQVLIQWLERKVKEERGRLILIETSSQPKYEKARNFFQKMGYQQVARIIDFYRPGDDLIIYAKYF
ncbi:MAG: GNAT family N-acetyltransferase [Candidatus Aminicenantes bacterium]|nr:GNAT family N-acetyltransferase [Candidatus Aminicenantes bacterium]